MRILPKFQEKQDFTAAKLNTEQHFLSRRPDTSSLTFYLSSKLWFKVERIKQLKGFIVDFSAFKSSDLSSLSVASPWLQGCNYPALTCPEIIFFGTERSRFWTVSMSSQPLLVNAIQRHLSEGQRHILQVMFILK